MRGSSFLTSTLLVLATTQCLAPASVSAFDDADVKAVIRGTLGVMCGVDWRGYDMGSLKESDPNQCAFSCFKKYQDAETTTWTNYEGGTCWCKNARVRDDMLTDKITSNAGGITSTMLAFARSEVFGRKVATYDNVDMPGYDITDFKTGDREVCSALCLNYSGCFAFTVTNYNGGTCWLKGRASALVPSPGAYSAVVMRPWRTDGDKCTRL